jgi:hypothetical protein
VVAVVVAGAVVVSLLQAPRLKLKTATLNNIKVVINSFFIIIPFKKSTRLKDI